MGWETTGKRTPKNSIFTVAVVRETRTMASAGLALVRVSRTSINGGISRYPALVRVSRTSINE